MNELQVTMLAAKWCVNLGSGGNSMRDQQRLRLKIAFSAAIAAMLALSGSAEAASTCPYASSLG